MGYATESREGLVVYDTTWLAPIATQTPADKANARVVAPITILRVGGLVTTAMTATSAVVEFDKRTQPGGGTRSNIASITLPVTGSAIGQIVYKDIWHDVAAGDEIVLELITASTAGAAVFFMEWIPRAEVPGNSTDYVASA